MDQMHTDIECTNQIFEELCEEEIRMYNEMNQQVNHVSSLIQEMSNDHIDSESMNSGLVTTSKVLTRYLNSNLWSLRNWIDTFPTRIFDKNFEKIFNDERRFIANDHACSSESGDDVIGVIANAKGVSPLSNWLI